MKQFHIRVIQCYGVPFGSCVICILAKKDYSSNSVVLYSVTLQSVTGEGEKMGMEKTVRSNHLWKSRQFFSRGFLASCLFSAPFFNLWCT